MLLIYLLQKSHTLFDLILLQDIPKSGFDFLDNW